MRIITCCENNRKKKPVDYCITQPKRFRVGNFSANFVI